MFQIKFTKRVQKWKIDEKNNHMTGWLFKPLFLILSDIKCEYKYSPPPSIFWFFLIIGIKTPSVGNLRGRSKNIICDRIITYGEGGRGS